MYFDLLDHNVRGEDVVTFLAELRRRLGRLTVVWDRNQIHSKSKAVKAWLADHPDVVAEDFPGYVPDLNPDEGVWGWTKYGRLANLAATDKDELWDRVVDELIEVKFRPDLVRGFIHLSGLSAVRSQREEFNGRVVRPNSAAVGYHRAHRGKRLRLKSLA